VKSGRIDERKGVCVLQGRPVQLKFSQYPLTHSYLQSLELPVSDPCVVGRVDDSIVECLWISIPWVGA